MVPDHLLFLDKSVNSRLFFNEIPEFSASITGNRADNPFSQFRLDTTEVIWSKEKMLDTTLARH